MGDLSVFAAADAAHLASLPVTACLAWTDDGMVVYERGAVSERERGERREARPVASAMPRPPTTHSTTGPPHTQPQVHPTDVPALDGAASSRDTAMRAGLVLGGGAARGAPI